MFFNLVECDLINLLKYFDMSTIRNVEVLKEKPKISIPSYLIAEELDGIIFYYKGYRQVLYGEKTVTEIVGSSVLQFIILQYIIRRIAIFDPEEEKYIIGNNEAGLHLGHKRNVANDLAIYDAKKMTADKIIGKYADFPPEVVVEVDIDVEAIDISPLDGAYLKTKRMLEFGVKKVFWIFTKSQKILIATSNEPWQTVDWDKDQILIEDLPINIGAYLKKKGVGMDDESV